MKTLIALALLSFTAFAQEPGPIQDWRTTEDLTQQQALELLIPAVNHDLKSEERGEVCGVESVWSLKREEGRSQSEFHITHYAKGPYEGCSGTATYDCKVTFSRADKWQVTRALCEPVERF